MFLTLGGLIRSSLFLLAVFHLCISNGNIFIYIKQVCSYLKLKLFIYN